MEHTNLKQLFSQKGKDYIPISLFFIIFSVFVVFIIRPTLTEAFALKKEEADLRQIDQRLGQAVVHILNMQGQLEKNRNMLPLLSEAIPEQPKINKVISDIGQAVDDKVTLKKINVEEISLINKNKDRKLKAILLKVEASGSYENSMTFIKNLFLQRRIKSIKQVQFQKGTDEASKSAVLNLTIDMEGYYL